MRALQLLGHGTPGQFRLVDVPDPIPGPDEVVVAVRACGLNHLDLWLEEGNLPVSIRLPRTPGCEIAGDIHQVGTNVPQWKAGDRVAIQSNLFCGECEFCLRGDESLCLHGKLLGVDCDGGFAELVLVPERSLVRVPEQVTHEAAAALTLAGSTAMHMLTDRVSVRPDDWVLVIGGASGVGSAAIQIARGLGARVIATASTESKRNLSLNLGAERVVNLASEDWPAQIRKLTSKRGVDLVVEHVGGPVLEQVWNCVARSGTVVTCGATAGKQITLNLWPLFVKQQKLVGSYGRTRRDLIATLEWAAAGKLRPVIDGVYALAETPAAFAALRNRAVLGKAIVTP